MADASIAGRFDRMRLARFADVLVVAVAAALPWSTSATAILIVLWLIVLVPSLNIRDVGRELTTVAGALPVLLVLLGAVGTLWADVPWLARWHGLDPLFKLLAIPLLFAQFRRSNRGLCVFGGYVIACALLLVLSTVISIWPSLWWPRAFENYGVPVKNAATQSGEFVTCIFGLLFLARDFYRRRAWAWLIGVLILALGMLANVLFIAAGRTALVVMLALLVILAFKTLSGRGVAIFFVGVIALGAIAWFTSPYLRERTMAIWTDLQKYEATDKRNSTGERIEFWKKSIAFVREAPLIGHGTGSIGVLFTRAAVGHTGAAGTPTSNPHNQTFAVAIQLGLIGVCLLWAMWIAHWLLFRGNGLVEWIGLVVVVQNVVGSLFNSHLFDFVQGWVYVFGVGVAGGMVLKHLTPDAAAAAPTRSP